MTFQSFAGAHVSVRLPLALRVPLWMPLGLVLLAAPQLVLAQDGTGATVICDGDGDADCCMDDLYPGSLNCTANDVRVSGVADTGTTNMDGSCSDGPDGFLDECDITFEPVCDVGSQNVGADCSANPSICLDSNGVSDPSLCGDRCAFEGDTTSFTATFEVFLTAQERFDIGLYFAVDGDPNMDGALTGECAVSTLPEVGSFTRPDSSTGSYVDLDTTCKGGSCPQPGDLCGDIDSANNPIFYDPAVGGGFATVVCVANENGKLNLPNCTSWRQSGANEVCLGPLDAFPGSPSKCNCQPQFEVPIEVPQAELVVQKTPNPSSVNEPGGPVTFTASVTNQGIDPNNDVTLNSLMDDIYGDITQVQGDITSTTCSVPQTISPNGGTYTCTFTANVSGNGGDSETDTVTASGVDDNGNDISGEDDATVTINDVLPAIDVTKTANPTSVLEGAGESVTFTVVVDNDSTADALELISLTDDIHGDLNGQGDCSVPQTIAIGGSYSCSFTAVVDGPAFSSETDEVTAVGRDDEFVDDATTPNNKVSATDTATVNINDDEAMIELIKDASPDEVDEPGANVTFSVTVNNLSSVDTVTINSLTDDIYGDITQVQGDITSTTCSVSQVLAPLGSYSCTFVGSVAGDGGDSHTNIATAMGVDDDDQAVMASDDATVDILDVPPAASLTKTAVSAVVTYEVTVTNDSNAEELTLGMLSDDVYGNIADAANPSIVSTTCSVPQVLAPDDEAPGGLDTYTCSFVAETMTSPTVDTVTGTVSDNEGASVTPSDSAEVRFGDNVCGM